MDWLALLFYIVRVCEGKVVVWQGCNQALSVEMWATCVFRRENKNKQRQQQKKARETCDLLLEAVLFFKSLRVFY